MVEESGAASENLPLGREGWAPRGGFQGCFVFMNADFWEECNEPTPAWATQVSPGEPYGPHQSNGRLDISGGQ